MGRYLVRRSLLLIPTVLFASMTVFVLMRLAVGGDPVLYIIDRDEPARHAQVLRHELRLDRPMAAQYIEWLGRVATGDFGRSFQYPMGVRTVLLERLPATAELVAIGAAMALLVAVPGGICMAASPNRSGGIAVALSTVTLCVPDFCLAIVLIYIFSVTLRWLPTSGYVPMHYGVGANLAGMILPAASLAAWYAAVWARYIGSGILDACVKDYVRAARARGLAESAVLWRHVLRNALLPTITIVGQNIAGMFGGVVAVETVFSSPGLGRLFSDAVLGRDYPVIQGVVLLLAFLISLSSLAVDICYGLADPRIRYS
jgi:peptide/nickel transport system permease protein